MLQADKNHTSKSITGQIIDFASRYQSKVLHGLTTGTVPAPSSDNSSSLLALPFVTLPADLPNDWGEFWRQTTLWNDEPTGQAHIDYKRGRQYARDAIAAIIKDGCRSRNLEMVVEALVNRGFHRRNPGGRLCRKLSSAEEGFLFELCN